MTDEEEWKEDPDDAEQTEEEEFDNDPNEDD